MRINKKLAEDLGLQQVSWCAILCSEIEHLFEKGVAPRMNNNIQQRLAYEPCKFCNKGDKCPGKCPKYEKWFRGVWRALRTLYLGEART